jgi:nucleotide-binding universal stress UspA family protein
MIIHSNQSILIPVDFSKQSLVAVRQAYNLARFTKSKIILMHVSTTNIDENKSELQELAETTRKASGLEVETLSLKGDLYELTDKKAEELNCSLIIIGLDSHVRFRSFLGGSSHVTKFIKNAPCPVITIRSAENRDGCRNIIMPFDLSPESREKVSVAVQLAHFYGGDIRIISVFHPNDDKYENKLLPYLQQVKKFIKEKGINCTNKSVPTTKPAEAIVEYANKNDGDLIVQMNQKDLSIGDMFSGTIGEKIVEISNLPVITIPPMKRESLSHFGSGM